MNLRSVFKHITADIQAGNAVLLKSQPGLGKTDLMMSVARWLAMKNPGKRIGMSTVFIATQNPASLMGLPWKGELQVDGRTYTVTDPAIPIWYQATDLVTGERRPANTFDLVLLVLEEWGQGDADTKRAAAELLRAGGIPPWYLPEGSPRIALSNVDANDGVTKEYDFIINRWSEYTVTGDVDVWVEDFAMRPYKWAGRTWQVMPATIAWAKINPLSVFEPKPKVQGPWCSPRSLTAADRYVQTISETNGGNPPLEDSGFFEGVKAKIGQSSAVSYLSHLRFRLDLPPMEKIIEDPAGTPVPERADLMMMLAYELAGRAKAETLGPIIQYVDRLPQDMGVAFFTSVLRRDVALVKVPALAMWIHQNMALVNMLKEFTAA